jgi:hypothetical protein
MLINFDLTALFLILNQVEAGNVVLDLDLTRQVDELSEGKATLVSREGMNSCFYSLIRYSIPCRDPKELNVVTLLWREAG